MQCKICKTSVGEEITVKIGEKGAKGLNGKSQEYGDTLLVVTGDVIHVKCRADYVKRCPAHLQDNGCGATASTVKTRSSTGGFDFRKNCFICGVAVTVREMKNGQICNVQCKDREIDKAIFQICEERNDDEWALEVRGRISSVNDLRAEDAIYHKDCNTKFRLLRPRSGKSSRKRGRPVDSDKDKAFGNVCEYLRDHDEEQNTLSELAEMMKGFLPSEYTSEYTTKWLESRLLKTFNDEIIVTTINGHSNVVTFVEKASKIIKDYKDNSAKLSEQHETSKLTEEEEKAKLQLEKIRIVEAAAKIIRSDVKIMESSKEFYPSPDEVESMSENMKYMPETLKHFLSTTFNSKDRPTVPIASIGQAIMQAIRPRAIIAPLKIALGVLLHKNFASRFLIDLLYELGFTSSYPEVQKYERSAAFHQGIDLNLSNLSRMYFLQYVADNVDYNKLTLTGEGTFHGMGIIVNVTPKYRYKISVPRLKDVPTTELLKVAAIESQTLPRNISSRIKFEVLPDDLYEPNNSLLNLWASSWLLSDVNPQWNGCMQFFHNGDHPGPATIISMPMIDQKATDKNCVYSTMIFVCEQALKYNSTPLLTFDQPLYWIAEEIKSSNSANPILSNCIVRLGGFHMCMTFLGAIGHLMQGTGLAEIFELIYADNAVPKIVDGKAYSRAIRAHLLLYGTIIGLQLSKYENDENLTHQIKQLVDDLVNSKISFSDLETNHSYQALTRFMESVKALKSSLTARVWTMYIEMIEILLQFLEGERTGNWKLHLKATRKMMSYKAAAGRYLYLKSDYLYLQRMSLLEHTHPDVYQKFMQGYHVVRRTDRFWAGLSTDLVIEQVLMRSIKARGGMTRGGGMTECQRAVWLLSTPITSEMNRALQSLAGVAYETSEQHKECRDSRIKKDHSDAAILFEYLTERDPFDYSPKLANIDTGEVATDNVNVYDAKAVGEKIIVQMIGVDVFSYSFSRTCMVTTMKTKSSIEIDGDRINVDPMLLFQRLVLLVKKDENQLKDAFSHELSTLPASLFAVNGYMNEANKPLLANELSTIGAVHLESVPSSTHFVIDGGYLIQRLVWKKGKTFSEICKSYVSHLKKHYGTDTTVVFDGYASSTKDMTHIRRANGKVGKTIILSLNNKLTVTKDKFLVNVENKTNFIAMLGDVLREEGFSVRNCIADADLHVVQEAVMIATNRPVCVIGEDTDVLALLLHHSSVEAENIYFTSEQKSNAKSPPKIWHIKGSKQTLGNNICENLLALHAITGCDTTSRIHSIGKGTVLQKFVKDEYFRDMVQKFNQDDNDQISIMSLGEKILISILGGKDKTLDDLRLRRYHKKMAESKTALSPEMLGPTSDSGKLHMLRAYFQLQEWKGKEGRLRLEDWGWIKTAKYILPIPMTKPPAPASLLKVLRCGCNTGCKTAQCGCKKLGVKCTSLCSGCNGVSCLNAEPVTLEQ